MLSLAEKRSAPIEQQDFDFKVVQYLRSIHESRGRSGVRAALAHLLEVTSGKTREGVRSWPAYALTLLRKWDHNTQHDISSAVVSPEQFLESLLASDGADDLGAEEPSSTPPAPPAAVAHIPSPNHGSSIGGFAEKHFDAFNWGAAPLGRSFDGYGPFGSTLAGPCFADVPMPENIPIPESIPMPGLPGLRGFGGIVSYT
jgi:hypothetical protein